VAQEHPLLLRSLGVHGARAMFHRHDSRKEIVVGREYVPSLDLHEASELDGMLQQLFAQDYVPIPDDLWDMPALVDLRLRRSGIERGGQRLPASGFAEKISGAVGLGVFTLLPEQASFKVRSFPCHIFPIPARDQYCLAHANFASARIEMRASIYIFGRSELEWIRCGASGCDSA
jgi:hypothetical protein